MIIKNLQVLLNKRYARWLKKRIPEVDSITLNRGNTFVFPSRFGLVFLTTCIVMFLIGTNYQNNLVLFLVFFLLSFMVTCLLLSYQNLSGLVLTTMKGNDHFAGAECAFTLRVDAKENIAQQTTYVFQHASSDINSVVDDRQVQLFAKNSQRGWFKPGRVTVQSYYPFGLFKVWTHLDLGLSCLLYPTPIENPLENIALSGEETKSGGLQTKVGVDAFSSLKPFMEGESLKSVAWKQVAQGRGWFTKQFEQEQGGDVYLSLSAFKGIPIEEKLSMLTYQVLSYEQQGVSYALDLGHMVIKVNSGPTHYKSCLRALALYGQEHA